MRSGFADAFRSRWRRSLRTNPLPLLESLAHQSHATDRALETAVRTARLEGNSWEEIGKALGVAKQTAWQKYAGGEEAMTTASVADSVKACSFCGKARKKAKYLVCAPSGSSICEECVALAVELIEKRSAAE